MSEQNVNDDSILNSVKKTLGIDPEYTVFDQDIIMHINSVLSILVQMNIGIIDETTGSVNPFIITSSTEKWNDFIGDSKYLSEIKTYVSMKVRLIFDPPSSSVIIESMNNIIKEFEWRMYIKQGGY